MPSRPKQHQTVPAVPAPSPLPVVAFFEVLVPVSLNTHTQVALANEALSVWWCGKSHPNVYDDKGRIVEDPSIPWTPEMRKGLAESQCRMQRTDMIRLEVLVRADGTKEVSVPKKVPPVTPPPSQRRRKPL